MHRLLAGRIPGHPGLGPVNFTWNILYYLVRAGFSFDLSDHLENPEHHPRVTGCDTSIRQPTILLHDLCLRSLNCVYGPKHSLTLTFYVAHLTQQQQEQFLTSLVMTLCRPQIRTYHLPGDEWMRYVLSHDREFNMVQIQYLHKVKSTQ